MENALSNGDSDFLAEYSFVDEAQDLPPVILAMIKKSTKRCVFLIFTVDGTNFGPFKDLKEIAQ